MAKRKRKKHPESWALVEPGKWKHDVLGLIHEGDDPPDAETTAAMESALGVEAATPEVRPRPAKREREAAEQAQRLGREGQRLIVLASRMGWRGTRDKAENEWTPADAKAAGEYLQKSSLVRMIDEWRGKNKTVTAATTQRPIDDQSAKPGAAQKPSWLGELLTDAVNNSAFAKYLPAAKAAYGKAKEYVMPLARGAASSVNDIFKEAPARPEAAYGKPPVRDAALSANLPPKPISITPQEVESAGPIRITPEQVGSVQATAKREEVATPKQSAKLSPSRRNPRVSRQAANVPARSFSSGKSSSAGKWLDTTQATLDAVGVIDPTPIADGVNAAISLGRAVTSKSPEERNEHLTNAGISTVSALIPYFGDLAKLGKLGKYGRMVSEMKGAKKIEKAISNVGGVGNAKTAVRLGANLSPSSAVEMFASLGGWQGVRSAISGPMATSDEPKAGGGGTFVTQGPTKLTVGDNPGGAELVTVTPLSGVGETKVPGAKKIDPLRPTVIPPAFGSRPGHGLYGASPRRSKPIRSPQTVSTPEAQMGAGGQILAGLSGRVPHGRYMPQTVHEDPWLAREGQERGSGGTPGQRHYEYRNATAAFVGQMAGAGFQAAANTGQGNAVVAQDMNRMVQRQLSDPQPLRAFITNIKDAALNVGKWGEALKTSQEHLKNYNAIIARASATSQIRDVQRAVASGRRTGASNADLQKALADFKDSLQIWKDGLTIVFNRLTWAILSLETVMINGVKYLSPIGSLLRAILDKDAKREDLLDMQLALRQVHDEHRWGAGHKPIVRKP